MTVEILTEQGHSDVRAIPIQFALNTETVPGPTPEPPVFAENTPPPQGEPVSSTTPQENL